MSGLARLSLTNRSIVALVSLAVMVFGVTAAFATKQELIPSLAFPTASITTTYAGASAEIVEQEVTEPIESAIAGLDGLESRTSTTSNGTSVVQAQFEYGSDADQAVEDVEQAIDQISAQLPEDTDPQVQSMSSDDFPVILLAAGADTSQRELAGRLEDRVVPELTSISGVREAQVTGERLERIEITLDQEALADQSLTASQVTQALQANGISFPGGQLTEGNQTLAVQVGDSYDSIGDLKNLELTPSTAPPTGTESTSTQEPAPEQLASEQAATEPTAAEPVRLSEVATVRAQLEPETTITRTDGERTLGISITKTSDGNSVSISEAVKDQIPDLEDDLGDNAELTVIQDQAPFIADSIEDLTTEGGLGLLFAVLVILVFLLSVRSTLVTAVSIPMSLLMAIIGLYVGGYSFNMLTLGALTIAVGRVVDDSIVVLENIKRHLGYGEEKIHAILAGVREVAGAVTASTLTTVGVFLPIAFVGGQVGELFRPFAVTVSIALLASLLVALTVIPVLAYWFLRPQAASPEEQERVREEALAAERRNPLQRAYVPVIKWVTKHRVSTVLVGLLVFAGTFALVPQLQTNFLPSFGENSFQVTQTMPVGTSLARTDEAAQRTEDVLKDLDDIEDYQVTVGGETFDGDGMGGAGGASQATFQVTTNEEADQAAFEDDLRDRLRDMEGAGEFEVAAGTGGSGGDGGSNGLEVVVSAPTSTKLETASSRVAEAVRETPKTTEVKNNLASDMPSVDVNVHRGKAAEYGLSESQIGQAVQQVFEGQQQATAVLDGTEQDVVLRTNGVPDTVEELRDLELGTASGDTVRLARVADVERVERPAEITHTDGDRTASVTAKATGSDVGAVTEDLRTHLDDVDLPAGTSYELGGVSEDQTEAFGQMIIALLAAIAIVFTVMVATFRSIAQPLILLVSIPFAATGAIGLSLLTDTALGMPGMIGMLMLVGIVVTNAIVLIDLINQYRKQGMSVRDAVVEGGRRRLRPILMTAVATICALLPMAFGLTGGGVFISQPLAIVVIGGLVSSTLLTLILVPTLYTIVEGFKERRQGKRQPEQPPASASPEQIPVPVAEPAITGRVYGADSYPANALLTLTDLGGQQVGRAHTGEDGGYRLRPPDEGTYLIVCTPIGNGDQPGAELVTVTSQPVSQDIHLGRHS